MKSFKIQSINIQNNAEGGNCTCSSQNCVWLCENGNWTKTSEPCGCISCVDINQTLPCDQNNAGQTSVSICIGFDNVYRSCLKGYDANGCAILGDCSGPGCIRPCSVQNPCNDTNPCCNTITVCDNSPGSPTCGQCVTEQTGEPSDCFNCPECDSSDCDPTDPPPPPPPPPPPAPPPAPPPPPSPPSPPSPPPKPCEKYVSGTYEYRNSTWVCVDKITRQEIDSDCCDLLPPEPQYASITVTWSEQNTDLIGSWFGKWNLIKYLSSGQYIPSINEAQVGTDIGPLMLNCAGGTGDTYVRAYASASPIVFNRKIGIASGDLFQVSQSNNPVTIVDLPSGYVSDTPISGSMIFNNESIDSVFGTQLDNGPVIVAYDGFNNSILFKLEDTEYPPSPPTPEPTTIGPTPEPEIFDPCSELQILAPVVDNIVLFEKICNCKCHSNYRCFNGFCVQDPNGNFDSYLSCLHALCESEDCENNNPLPEPTPLPKYPSVCQDPLIIDQ